MVDFSERAEGNFRPFVLDRGSATRSKPDNPALTE
jgi:hypothetical protein